MANTAEVLSTGQVLVTEITAQLVEVTVPSSPVLIEILTTGSQGTPITESSIGQLQDVTTVDAVDNSVLVFDATSNNWVGSDVFTVTSLTDGGNF
jgi:hypothetical protein